VEQGPGIIETEEGGCALGYRFEGFLGQEVRICRDDVEQVGAVLQGSYVQSV
jgi:hypothetical protein